MNDKNQYNLLCPKCKKKLEILGSECYPESGFDIECLNCDFEITISCSDKVNQFKDVIIKVFKLIEKNLE